DEQKTKLLPRVKKYFDNDLKGKTIAIWGLAFKPYTDDIREAPALENIKALLAEGAMVRAYDPEAMENVKRMMHKQVYFAKDAYDALEDADALMIMTEWPLFRTPDFSQMNNKLKNKVIFDGRNVFELNEMREYGYDYYSIGREDVLHEKNKTEA
ncbi:MAG: UDP-glucose/GDP-mannose dehydrogenase family protein, partial [Verrucomicrobia bacterium]|nr:UDP-glucose/GDP-mannose dehydrogenase family protein [Cytophagales bacterium]